MREIIISTGNSLFLPLFIILFLTTNLFARQAETDPILHLAFDGEIVDLSGNNPEIQVNGGTFVEDREGNPNSAFYFDGEDDGITIPDTDNALDAITNETGITFMAWIKVEGFPETTSRSIFFERYDEFINDYWESEGYHFGVNNVGQIHVRARNIAQIPQLLSNNWVHIAISLKSGKCQVYANGLFIEEGEAWLLSASDSPITIGSTRFSDQTFIGAIDDLKVFDYVVDKNVIRENAGLPPIIDEDIFAMSFSGNLSDSSKYAHTIYELENGDIVAGSFIEDRFGNPNHAYSFAETNRVFSNKDESFYAAFTQREVFSVSLWLYIDSYPSDNYNRVIMEMPYRAWGQNPGFSLQLNSYGRLNFYTGAGRILQKDAVPQKQWVHIVITYDGERRKLYINGKEKINVEEFGNIFNDIEIKGPQRDLFIGGSSKRNYENALDDIKIFNYVLGESKIEDLYDYQHQFEKQAPGIVMHLPFGGSVRDSSDYGNSVYINGGHLTEDRFGNEGGAFNLLSDDNIRISNQQNRLDSLYQGVTFSTWIKVEDFGDGYSRNIILSKTDQEPADKLKVWLFNETDYSSDGHRIYFEVNGKESFVASNDLVEGHWLHLAATYDGETMKTFLNGELIRTVQYSTSLSLTESDIYIGGKPEYLRNEQGFSGSIDDTRLYNYALPDSAIKAFYDLDRVGRKFNKELLAYLAFDGGIVDSSSNNNITEIKGVELSRDRFDNENKAYKFNNESDAITIKDETAELDSIYAGLTLQAWVKINEFPENGASIIHRKGSSEFGQFQLGIAKPINIFNFHVNSAELIGGLNYSTKRGLWYLITGTFENSTMKLYMNGELVRQGPYSGRLNFDNSDIIIGNSDNFLAPFNGVIDEVRIYNYALEKEEIEEFYSDRFTGYDLPPQKLIHLSFNNSLHDSSNTHYTVVANQGGYVVDRFGNSSSAYTFDGIDDAIVMHDENTKLDSISYGMTLSTWFKIREEAKDFPTSTIISRSDEKYDEFYMQVIDGRYNDGRYNYWASDAEGIQFGIGDSYVRFRDIPIKVGNWLHVTGTYDGNKLKLYVNGDFVNSTS